MNRLKQIFNYETISYVIVGVLTTVTDYVVFAIVNESLKHSAIEPAKAAVAATAVSWVAAVLFAYIANKLVVFKSYDFSPRHLLKEAAGFFAARIISGLISIFLMWLMTGVLRQNEYLAKVLTSVFNLVFNYAASKVFIFRH